MIPAARLSSELSTNSAFAQPDQMTGEQKPHIRRQRVEGKLVASIAALEEAPEGVDICLD